jgi:hypothetical protein
MKSRSAVFVFALLGVIGSGRLADAQPPEPSPGAPLLSEKGVPPIDAIRPSHIATATFALG